MKITIDSKSGIIKRGNTEFKDLKPWQMDEVRQVLEKTLGNSGVLSEYDIDSMWMSYRYCIGRHTISSSMRAYDIKTHCYGKLTRERSLFTAFDINREIEDILRIGTPSFWFPSKKENRVDFSALDCIFEFFKEYNINKDNYLDYKDINIILTDNERGYKFETTTWEEYLRPQILKIMQDFYDNNCMSEDFAWNLFQKWKNGNKTLKANLDYKLIPLTKNMPSKDYIYSHIMDFEDLMIWNDLCHIFDLDHHHKSLLSDGTVCEWFWTWTKDHENENIFGYKKIRVPIDYWKGGSSVIQISPDAIVKDLW